MRGPGAILDFLLSWALFLYLVRRAWPGIKADLRRLSEWSGIGRPRMVRRGPSSRAAASAAPPAVAVPADPGGCPGIDFDPPGAPVKACTCPDGDAECAWTIYHAPASAWPSTSFPAIVLGDG